MEFKALQIAKLFELIMLGVSEQAKSHFICINLNKNILTANNRCDHKLTKNT